MKLLLVKAMADDHLYTAFARSLARALAELGHEAAITDQHPYTDAARNSMATRHYAAELQAARYDAVISFNSLFGAVMLNDGRSLHDALGVRFVGWQLDHPVYAPQSLARGVQDRLAIYSHGEHLRYACALKLPGRCATLLPAAEPPTRPAHDFHDRDWPLFVAATYRGEPGRAWDAFEDSPAKRLLSEVVDELTQDPRASLLEAFDRASAALGLGAKLGADPTFDDQISDFLRAPLTYVRNMDRLRIVSGLVESGLPIVICGSGWERRFGERKNVTYLESVPFADLGDLYARARVAVNLNAGNGASERAIQAACAGAAVMSDGSGELDQLFGGGRGIAFYDRAHPVTAAEVAASLVESRRAEEVAQAGHERVMRRGLWRHRAEELIGMIAAG